MRRLNEKSVASYRSIWTRWLKYVGEQGVTWQDATWNNVLSFLGEMKPRAVTDDRPSTVSQRRYARVMSDVYTHAKVCELIRVNPVRLDDPLVPPSEDAESIYFRGDQYDALVQNLPDALNWQAIRNRAILACFLLDALSASEVVALTVDDVIRSNGDGARKVEQSRVAHAHVRGTDHRSAQARKVRLAWKTTSALAQWIRVREKVAEGKGKILFVSERGERTLTPKALNDICKEHVARSLASLGTLDIRWTHAGPTSLRNSCMLRWLEDGWPPKDVATRAGLSRASQLDRLLRSTLFA